jgi:anti-sigma B factor antagonist
MSITHEIADGVDVVFLDGRIDAQSAPGVNQDICRIMDNGQDKMLISCLNLEYISSAGLRVLITVAKKLKAGRKQLALCNLSEKIHEVFDVSGFTAIFKIYPTKEEALEALGGNS